MNLRMTAFGIRTDPIGPVYAPIGGDHPIYFTESRGPSKLDFMSGLFFNTKVRFSHPVSGEIIEATIDGLRKSGRNGTKWEITGMAQHFQPAVDREGKDRKLYRYFAFFDYKSFTGWIQFPDEQNAKANHR